MRRRIRSGESTSQVVIRAVADVTDRDPLDLEPIAESIDPDVFDEMFTRSSGDGVESLTLLYEGCRVEVESDTVYVDPIR